MRENILSGNKAKAAIYDRVAKKLADGIEVPSEMAAATEHEAAIDTAYRLSSVLLLSAHAADSINSGSVSPDDAKRIAGDMRGAIELAEEMVSGLLDYLERTVR